MRGDRSTRDVTIFIHIVLKHEAIEALLTSPPPGYSSVKHTSQHVWNRRPGFSGTSNQEGHKQTYYTLQERLHWKTATVLRIVISYAAVKK